MPPGATKIEKVFSSYAFTEGWAHYTEKMIIEEGFGGPDSLKAAKYHLAQLNGSLLRLCRLCVSVKTHCEGMSLADATKFFQDNAYYEYKPAYQEALRGTFDPGYLSYTLGKLQILQLREDYKKQEGVELFVAEISRYASGSWNAAGGIDPGDYDNGMIYVYQCVEMRQQIVPRITQFLTFKC